MRVPNMKIEIVDFLVLVAGATIDSYWEKLRQVLDANPDTYLDFHNRIILLVRKT